MLTFPLRQSCLALPLPPGLRHGGALMAEGLTVWMRSLIPSRFATPSAFARAMGMSLTTFQRGMDSGSFGAENLLRLARVTGESADRVLALAGKESLAKAIADAYGPPREPQSPAVREVVERFEAIPDPALREDCAQLMARLLGRLTRPPDAARTDEGQPE